MKKAISLAFAAILFTSGAASAADCSSPKSFVQSTSDEVIKIIQAGGSDADKEKKLSDLFLKTVDGNWMGKFVMGRNWKGLTPDQQQKFLAKYNQYLIASYVPTFRKYNGEKIDITGSSELEGDTNVGTTIARQGQQAVNVSYRLRKEGACYKVTDINGEGISLINTQRQDFASVFNSQGFDGLMSSLDQKIANPAPPVE